MRIAGIGFRSGTPASVLAEALRRLGPFEALATAEAKGNDPEFQALVRNLTIDLHLVSQDRLAAHARPGSRQAEERFGTGSVAESAALAAAGPGARLVVSKLKGADGRTVVALAETA